ncbi:MAG TPA: tRNA (adenosine(37)-N6)-threonylcarbamoyltransferase complex dimerization subunit type 1 TsaB [Gemmatimonadaceae bacterium]|jgi:tRNA threonylcarbamoyladenosine biosynthesis protein TsaB|nr:tRNA (adenosine(37)-N6)-threonylcarbamoyltransferase complex dimerization subunit type 1 TsaB [Gemmatimonadaceae bacterium]
MITLVIDASTYDGDVAVLDDDRVLAERRTVMRDALHERLMPAVAEALETAGIEITRLDRVVCGAGPGSFTSLRIAASIAKGIAMATDTPLFAISSLALLVGGTELSPGRYVAALDALRGEFYVGLYEVDVSRAIVELEPARLIAAEQLESVAAAVGAVLVTPSDVAGAVRASPRARAASRLRHLIERGGRVDVSAWEPAYGRLAEAQVRWEAVHGVPLPTQ